MSNGPTDSAPSAKRILAFWLPLAATWLMMGIEGPYVAAIIARLADAKVNLAAYGVTFSFAFLAEAPIIMVMTASNALVSGRESFFALRRFVYWLNAAVTIVFAVALYPPLFRFVTIDLMDLPPEIAHITHVATAILLPWPAAIGYRRFYQGILIRNQMPRRVAYGTIVRVATMSIVAVGVAMTLPLRGAYIGSLALVSGVVSEAVASRLMARRIVAQLRDDRSADDAPLGMLEIARFYYPLALTSLITLAVNPVLTFFVAHSRAAIESLAVMPVVSGLAFLFRSGAIAYQETTVAMMSRNPEGRRALVRVARGLAAASMIGLGAIAYTPLAGVWFGTVSGLSDELSAFALWPLRVAAFAPLVDYLLTFQRAIFILARRTRVITLATAVEVMTLVLVLFAGVHLAGMVGALAAMLALVSGRIAGNLLLLSVPLGVAVRSESL